MKIRQLTLGGIGFLMPVQIGCVKYIEESGILNDIDLFVGSSSGSIISLLTCMHVSWEEQHKLFQRLVLRHPVQYNCIDHVFEMKGIDDGQCLYRMLDDILDHMSLSRTITFKGFHEKCKQRKLVITGANVTDACMSTFSVDNEPDMEIRIAVRISCSIPILMTPVFYKGKAYVDACFLESNYHTEPADAPGNNLIINIETITPLRQNCLVSEQSDFISYLYALFCANIIHQNKLVITKRDILIDIPLGREETIFFANSERTVDRIRMGYDALNEKMPKNLK